MSRILMVAVLAILLSLLAVMANIVNPKAKEPPKPPDPAVQAKEQEAREQKEREMMKEQMTKRQNEFKKRQEQILRQEQASGITTNLKSRPKSMKPVEAAPNPTAMDISSDWFTKRKDGSEGLTHLAEEQKRLEEAARKFREKMAASQAQKPDAK